MKFMLMALAGMLVFSHCGARDAGDDLLELLAPGGLFLLSGECMLITRTGEGENRSYRALATSIPRVGCAREFLGPGEIITELADAKQAADAVYQNILNVYEAHSACAAPRVALNIARGLAAADAFNLDASTFLGTSAPLKLNFNIRAAAEDEISRCVPAVSFIPGSPLYCISRGDALSYSDFIAFRVVENARDHTRVSMEHHRSLHEQSRGVTGLSTDAAANMALMGIAELPLLTEAPYAAATLAHLLRDFACRDAIIKSNQDLRSLFMRMLGAGIDGVGVGEAGSVTAALAMLPEDPLPACVYGPGAAPDARTGTCPEQYEEF